jgi:hypothetical protein
MMLPIPPDAAIEGGGNGGPGDSHGLILDRDNYMIYEIYDVTTERLNGGKLWHSSCCAIFNGAGTNTIRPRYWTSTDAAGLSVFAGLLKYQEIYVEQQLRHCVRFTAVNTRRAFLPPATHYASSLTGTNYIPMGAKVRLKASYPTYILSGGTKVVADGLKKYGMIMADNGANWYVSGAPDSRWTSEIGGICMLGGSDFEVVKMVGLVSQ